MSDQRSNAIHLLELPFVRRLRDFDARLTWVGPRRAAFSRIALVALNIAVLSLNAWDMKLKHVSHKTEDFTSDGIVVGLTIFAAGFLPAILREGVLSLYASLLIFDLTSAPIHFRYLLEMHGGETDIFFGSLVWMVQSLLLAGYGVGSISRFIVGRRRPR